MASFVYTYSELYNRVSKFLGTYGSSGPTTEAKTEAQEFVKSGLAKFLSYYDWSFRRKYTTLSFAADQWEYELPTNFGGIRTQFQYTSQTGYPPLEERAEGEILELRSYGENSSYPMYYAIRAGNYDPEVGQRYELIVWPTPQSSYTVYYSYYYMPPMLSNDDDVPMAGTEHAETILKFCLAAAESEGDEMGDGPQSAAAMECMANSIRIDKMREPRQLGPLTDGRGMSPWQVARGGTRINDVSYNL